MSNSKLLDLGKAFGMGFMIGVIPLVSILLVAFFLWRLSKGGSVRDLWHHLAGDIDVQTWISVITGFAAGLTTIIIVAEWIPK